MTDETAIVDLEQELRAALPPAVCAHGTPKQMAALYGALAAAQGGFESIVKNRSVKIEIKDDQRRKVGEYVFRYADLEEVTAKTRPALSKNGLATIQPIGHSAKGGTALFMQLVHQDGGMLISEWPLASQANDIKALGAKISYLRRYLKTSMLDVAADDDLDEQPQDGAGDTQAQTQTRITRDDKNENQVGNRDNGGEDADDGFYGDAEFAKNLVGYTAAAAKGTDPERIIKMGKMKKQFTDAQIATIRGLASNQPTDSDSE